VIEVTMIGVDEGGDGCVPFTVCDVEEVEEEEDALAEGNTDAASSLSSLQSASDIALEPDAGVPQGGQLGREGQEEAKHEGEG